MATRRALIVNPSVNQIQEISNTDTLSAPTFSGNGTIPVGGIIMWSGSIASIPTGWALCDGSSGTPNLTDRFVVGAGSGYSVDATGGSADAIVVSHSHTASSISTSITSIIEPNNGQGHQHSVSGQDNDAVATGSLSDEVANVSNHNGPNNFFSRTTSFSTTGITASTSTETTTTVDPQGSSGTNANLPPYYALAFIMRTA